MRPGVRVTPLTFGSVCSGIEGASVAWSQLGWRCAFMAEVEAFPRAVLKHHYPETPLFGDFTKLRDHHREVLDVDVLVGGTPCQGFSVAGLRGSLGDDRSNLCLEFIRLADAIDDLRRAAGRPPCWVLWENVPGVFSTEDNAFGCFMGGLVGCDAALDPGARGKWSDAGVAAGPLRVAAWRVLDAQHFGLAQRRRRIFVLALGGAGAWRSADALLPIADSLQGHPAPRRQAGKGTAPTISARTSAGGGLGTDFDCDGGLIAAEISPTMRTGDNHTGGGRPYGHDADACHSLVVTLAARGRGDTHQLEYRDDGLANAILTPAGGRGGTGVGAVAVVNGNSTPELGDDLALPLRANDGSGNRQAIAFAQNTRDEVRLQGEGDISGALNADEGMHQRTYLAFDTTQMTHPANRSHPQPGDPSPPVTTTGHPPAVAFTLHGADGTVSTASETESAAALRAREPGKVENSTTTIALQGGSAVRRLTPTECERLQGFPDGYTDVPFRGRAAADGPRYKALGNSFAVPVVAWIGERISAC